MSLPPIEQLTSRGEILAPGEGSLPPIEHEEHVRRIPNLGHAALFVGFAVLMVLLFTLASVMLGGVKASPNGAIGAVAHPRVLIFAQAGAYLATLIAAWLFFPMVWRRPFLEGLQWRWPAAQNRAGKLLSLGFVLGFVAAAASAFIKTPKTLPLDKFLSTPTDAWFLVVFGIFVAPAFEEICYRGFLLPAFAIAFDWVRLPRTPEAQRQWQTSRVISGAGMIFATILSSIFFAMMHFEQDAHLWVVMLVLFCVSVVLTAVRVKTGSVAASTLVHAAYNSFQLITLAVATGGFRHLDKIAG
ncbi:MAG TPA: CPBP family intramembrane glutamic endopeptidase [Acidobacteriaceae bacterium]|nr:CPBP family intramembrane glutamic endopeptidase [Acidobacteriaceae bacterium]